MGYHASASRAYGVPRQPSGTILALPSGSPPIDDAADSKPAAHQMTATTCIIRPTLTDVVTAAETSQRLRQGMSLAMRALGVVDFVFFLRTFASRATHSGSGTAPWE